MTINIQQKALVQIETEAGTVFGHKKSQQAFHICVKTQVWILCGFLERFWCGSSELGVTEIRVLSSGYLV